MPNPIESPILRESSDSKTGMACLDSEDLDSLNKLSRAEVRQMGRLLAESDAPVTEENCRQTIRQFLLDGGSLALLRM